MRETHSQSEIGACPMEGSTRRGEVCLLLTSFVSCVVFGPWRRKLPCLQAARFWPLEERTPMFASRAAQTGSNGGGGVDNAMRGGAAAT
eukprot:4729044-Pleurochrysis_carterae.AAC.12